jgi:hypothetical protein
MKIDITNKQYKVLIKALEVSSFIYGPMSDFGDKKYKKDIKEIEDVESELLKYTKDFKFDKNTESFDGELVVKEGYYTGILDDLENYDEQQLFENLANKLGKRDFRNKFSKEEIKKMSEDHGGYLGVPMYDFEKKYYDEFDSNGYDRLFIRE